MQRLGLALSGGGFRAVLYHLGVVRFLRDAGLLPQVTHITAVSGGSVLAAHLALNWDRYCGNDDDFQDVADEVLKFLQLDVRNRIVRRFPLASLANVARKSLRMAPRRQFTRAGLLEQHYEQFLYGDTSLFRLPESPQLHILATNLSEGSLCSFHREGLLLQRRTPTRGLRLEQVQIGLGTVPMAVAASSAFPGFFPPLELRNWEVGAREGDFTTLAFTDGGIYDNIGLRMFRHLQQLSQRDESAADLGEVFDVEVTASALLGGANAAADTPLRRLWEKLLANDPDVALASSSLDRQHRARILVEGLGAIIRDDELYRDSVLQQTALDNLRARALLVDVQSSPNPPSLTDRIWLNRQLVAAVLQQAVGAPCLRAGDDGFGGILVSDAGATFKVRAAEGRAGGLMSTAMRSTDILMDRVNQLELESFRNTPGVVFFPITKVVEPSQDPHAPHPEIQRHAARIRTDMDAFSDLEIAALTQHGYCVARQACGESGLRAAADTPTGPAWNPRSRGEVEDHLPSALMPLSDAGGALQAARELQKSSSRRIFSTLLNWHDWPTYLWVPLVAAFLLTLPYLLYRANKTAVQRGYVLSAISETSPLYRRILALIDDGPIRRVAPAPFEEVTSIDRDVQNGFEVLSDNRIFDLRSWTEGSGTRGPAPFVHSRLRVRRMADAAADARLKLQTETVDEQLFFVCLTESLDPRYRRMRLAEGRYLWELELDFSSVPLGTDTEVVFEGLMISEFAEQFEDEGRFQFSIQDDTGLAQIWMLMPAGREYDHFEISGWPIGKPEQTQTVTPTTRVELPIGSIATFQLINPKHDYRYECRWKWSLERE